MHPSRRPRVGIIGAGTAGGRHAAYLKLPDVELVAIAVPDAMRGNALAEQVGARYFQDASDPFWEAIDLVSICPPHNLLARESCRRNATAAPEIAPPSPSRTQRWRERFP